MNRAYRFIVIPFLVIAMLFAAAACSPQPTTAAPGTTQAPAAPAAAPAKEASPAAAEPAVRKVIFGIEKSSMPNTYMDANGVIDGENIAVAKAIDELLPQYEFAFEGVEQEAIFVGIDSGKYVGGLANFWKNAEREEKYFFPAENISSSVDGLILLKENAHIDSFQKLAEAGLTLTPKVANDVNYTFIQEWNKANPDKPQLKCETVAEKLSIGECMQMIMEGRYDCALFLKSNYDAVKNEVDPQGKLVFVPITSVKCYALFSKQEEQLCKDFSDAITQLKASGKMSEISMQYYGEDVFLYDN